MDHVCPECGIEYKGDIGDYLCPACMKHFIEKEREEEKEYERQARLIEARLVP